MIDWIFKIVSEIPELRKAYNYVCNKLQNYFLGKKSLIIELHWKPSNSQEPSSTIMTISTNCARTLTFVCYDRKITEHDHATFDRPQKEQILTLRSSKTSDNSFEVVIPKRSIKTRYVGHQPIIDDEDIMRKRIKNDIFYIDSKNPEVFHIPNTNKWFSFMDGAKHIYLSDTDGANFYVNKEGLKEIREKLKLEQQISK